MLPTGQPELKITVQIHDFFLLKKIYKERQNSRNRKQMSIRKTSGVISVLKLNYGDGCTNYQTRKGKGEVGWYVYGKGRGVWSRAKLSLGS